MTRDLGSFAPRRPHKWNGPLLAMLLNGLHDRHEGRVFVLQVGAGTGDSGVPLLPRFRDDGWSGLLIEPHPEHFAGLEALHVTSDRVAVLNLGLSDASGTQPLYSLSADAQQRVPGGRASFDPARLGRSGITTDDLQHHEVPVLRMETVLTELGIDNAQLVTINAGGAEAQVLAGFDLAALQPSVTLVHSRPDTVADLACISSLEEAGLLVFRVGDYLAGLRPGAVAVPLDELLTFFNRGIHQVASPE
jgi:FkbM family methyltransferase